MSNKTFEKFREKVVEIGHLTSALGLLEWDAQVNMPHKGSEFRGQTVATLSGLLHDKLLDKDYESLLLQLKSDMEANLLTPAQAVVVKEEYRVFEREKKLLSSFVKELAETTSKGHVLWVQAREENDFSKFAPILSKIVELKREEAKLVGYKTTPYDVMLDAFEPGLTSEEVSITFENLKNFLIPFIKRIADKKVVLNTEKLKGTFDIAEQKAFNKIVAERIGYDFAAGRTDESVHPFSSSFNPHDARITTRFKNDDVWYALGSTIHEVGHALYEQGLNPEHFGTPLGNPISHAVHESQSRVWENLVGKSLSFWKYFYQILQNKFAEPFKSVGLDEFYKLINKVEPSLVRVDSDEVTYNLHIIIRFEIEKELLEGSIDVADLPKIWNERYKQYLGVDVPSDSLGVLQDVHWSAGLFGYFPSYAIGNLYSAQFYSKAKSEIMNMEELFAKGQFLPFLEWLRKNIHQHGKFYTAEELSLVVTGEKINPQHYIDYITKKFSVLYNL